MPLVEAKHVSYYRRLCVFLRIVVLAVVVLVVVTELVHAIEGGQEVLFKPGPQELARQNQITKQILEAYIQKKLGLAKNANLRPPSVLEILPVKKKEERLTRQLIYREEQKDKEPPEAEEMEDEEDEETEEEPAPVEDEKLQSVESEHIDSVYPEGM